jgi:dihydrofolate synthase/folylpolyglutamate synthase
MKTPIETQKTLFDWLAHCEQLHPVTIDLGLERVRLVAERMQIRFDCPVITVAGTNGKGSTCVMLESILLQAGRAGRCYAINSCFRKRGKGQMSK